jgi:hypothetical protein
MISLKEYQDALKIVEAYRRQESIKGKFKVKPNPNIYGELSFSNDYHDMKGSMICILKTIAYYELPEVFHDLKVMGDLKLKHFAGLSKTKLLKYRNFGKRKLEILEHHLSLAGLHLEP